MTSKTFTILATLLSICSAIQGAFDDIPTQCQSVCGSLAEVSNECETLAGSNDTEAYISCACDGQGASTAIPLCEACIHAVKQSLNPNQGPREWSQDAANRLLLRCDFPRISSYDINTPSSTVMVDAYTSVVSGSTVIPTASASRDSTSSDHVTSAAATSASTAAGAASPTTSQSSSSHVQNLAAMPSMGGQGLSFLAGLGLLAAAVVL